MRIALRIAALLLAASLPATLVADEQPGPFASPAAAAVLSQPELDQLLAPIALHPDALLTQILMASTYPLEVVSLQRWLDRNPGLSAEALAQELERQPWDASVKALAPFPQVVAMMGGEIEWTQRLGNAFLAQQDAVMDTIQRLREKALEAGSLRDDSRERVSVDGEGMVIIEPATPDIVYVPAYDPGVVYGPWWWPGYPPYYWPYYYGGPWSFWVGGVGFGYGVVVGGGWHGHHSHTDWHRHHVEVRHPGGSGTWRHDPSHRGGVAYPDDRTRSRYGAFDAGSRDSRRDFRGFDVRPGGATRPGDAATRPGGTARPGDAATRPDAHPFARQAPRFSGPAQQPSPQPPRSALNPQPRDFGRAQSERGHASLGNSRAPSISRPAPSAAPRAPSAGHSSPAPSSQGSASHGSASHGGGARGGGARK